MRTSTSIALLCLVLSITAHLPAQDASTYAHGCMMLTTKGNKISITRFHRITEHFAEYEQTGSLHDIRLEDIRKLTCNGVEYTIRNGAILPVDRGSMPTPAARTIKTVDPDPVYAPIPGTGALPPTGSVVAEDFAPSIGTPEGNLRTVHGSAQDLSVIPERLFIRDSTLCLMGIHDAETYYDPMGAGILAFMTAGSLWIPAVVAAIPPKPTRRNPNLGLYHHEPDYRQGYTWKAKKRKGKAVGIGFGVGLALFLGVALSG